MSKDSIDPNYYLGDFEFCIRKGVGVYCVKKYLRLHNRTQTELASYLHITQPTISRWMNTEDARQSSITSTSPSRHAPTLMHILQMSSFFHKSIGTMLKEVISAEQTHPLLLDSKMLERLRNMAAGMEESTKDTYERKGVDHFGIINKLQKTRYLGFFISHDKQKHIEHFIIDTSDVVKSASVLAFTRVIGKAENIYRCNIVSPPNQKHLYIYLRQDSGKYDRGIIIFKVDNDIQGPFVCGSGIMLSTDRKSEEKRLQWVILIRIGENSDPLTADCADERSAPYIQSELAAKAEQINIADTLFERGEAVKTADAVLEPILREPLPPANGPFMDFACLKERQEKLYAEVYEQKLKNLLFTN